MSNVKHTPGPWLLVPISGVTQGFYIGTDLERDGMNVIAEIKKTKWTRDEQANASLIVRAPELLEALEQVQDCLIKVLTGGEVSAKLAGIAIANAALVIERAKGESK